MITALEFQPFDFFGQSISKNKHGEREREKEKESVCVYERERETMQASVSDSVCEQCTK